VKSHTVRGAAGVGLHVREWGNERGAPLVFIHGWSQSHLCWVRQTESELADEFRLIAFDLRGHGMSEAPQGADAYGSEAWALDVAAVIEALALERPILVGWSYGGYVIGDYLCRFGDGAIAGIDFVAAGVVLGPAAFGTLIGPGFLDHAPDACSDDLPTNIAAARRFVRVCLRSAPAEDLESSLAAMMVVPPAVRAALISREVDFSSELEAISVPVLASHGRADTVVLPAMSDHLLSHCKTATASWYEGVGHAPFLEAPARFNAELAAFARRALNDR
jgi:pimeloyl-ACP methyl ester carboxylesterase